jgi:hypothetical protein
LIFLAIMTDEEIKRMIRNGDENEMVEKTRE